MNPRIPEAPVVPADGNKASNYDKMYLHQHLSALAHLVIEEK